jgi:hypothetical protein
VSLRTVAGDHVRRARQRLCLSLQGLSAPHRAVIDNGSRWLKSQVRIEGEHKVYGRVADSGFEIRFHFCPNCGSSVFWEGDRSPTTCGIAVGCFADPEFPAPTSSGWEESMHHWLGLPPGTDHYLQSRS